MSRTSPVGTVTLKPSPPRIKVRWGRCLGCVDWVQLLCSLLFIKYDSHFPSSFPFFFPALISFLLSFLLPPSCLSSLSFLLPSPSRPDVLVGRWRLREIGTRWKRRLQSPQAGGDSGIHGDDRRRQRRTRGSDQGLLWRSI